MTETRLPQRLTAERLELLAYALNHLGIVRPNPAASIVGLFCDEHGKREMDRRTEGRL